MAKFKVFPINNQREALEYIKKLMIEKKYSSKKYVDKITLRTTIGNYLDSLDYVECIMEIEKRLKIVIPDEHVFERNTFGHLASLVVKAVKEKYI